jgi:hypothetical protein
MRRESAVTLEGHRRWRMHIAVTIDAFSWRAVDRVLRFGGADEATYP